MIPSHVLETMEGHVCVNMVGSFSERAMKLERSCTIIYENIKKLALGVDLGKER